MAKEVSGTVTINGQVYKAFQNSYSGSWYVVAGNKASDQIVKTGIEAKTAKQAIEQWKKEKE